MEVLSEKSLSILTFLEKNPNRYSLDEIYNLIPCNIHDISYLERKKLIKHWGYNPDGSYNETMNIDIDGQTYLSTLREHLSSKKIHALNYRKSLKRANVAIVISIVAILVQALIQLLK